MPAAGMRGRIFSSSLPRASVSSRLHTSRRFEDGVEKSSVRALSYASCRSSVSSVPELLASFRLPSSGPSDGTMFQPISCLESSALLFSTSSPSRSHVVWQRRSFVATGNLEKVNKTCWSCEHEISSGNGLFCSSCDAIQPLDLSVDHFRIFEISRSFQVDSKLLEQRYKNLQKKLHPDLMSLKSQKEQGFSADQSAHVIQAYYTLLRPLSRARYLLELQGIKVDEEGTVDEPALLMEIMEIRESLENVSDAKALQKFRSRNHSRIQETEISLEATFGAGNLKKAVSLVQRLAYYNKVDEEIVRKL